MAWGSIFVSWQKKTKQLVYGSEQTPRNLRYVQTRVRKSNPNRIVILHSAENNVFAIHSDVSFCSGGVSLLLPSKKKRNKTKQLCRGEPRKQQRQQAPPLRRDKQKNLGYSGKIQPSHVRGVGTNISLETRGGGGILNKCLVGSQHVRSAKHKTKFSKNPYVQELHPRSLCASEIYISQQGCPATTTTTLNEPRFV